MPGHDASTSKTNSADAAEINAAGGQAHRVAVDFELKIAIYGELNKQGDYGNLRYARQQEDLAKLHELPIDLELATENYRSAHMRRNLRTGFKIHSVNSTSRRYRAEWEGRELTAEVLAL